MALKSFCSPFLKTFEILPCNKFDDGASGNVFKVVGRREVVSPVSEVNVCGSQFIVKIVTLGQGPQDSKELREVELLKEEKVDHENVVRIFGSWEERPPLGFEYPNRPPINQEGVRLLFILMEYCDLFTLRQWLDWPRDKRSWEDLLNIFAQVTKGLLAIHGMAIIHRDLKPSNVGLTCHWTEERVVAKLIDFGLATKLSDEMTSKVGTHVYRSPEIHDNRNYDEKADIYSLGIILCQMIVSFVAEPGSFVNLDTELYEFIQSQADRNPLISVPFDATCYFKKYQVAQHNVPITQLVNLAQLMTCNNSQERPSSQEVLERIKEITPGIEKASVSIYNYLEEFKEKQTCLSAFKCTNLRPIKISRLNHLTHLTLKNIRLTKQSLFKVCKECFVLKHLSLSLQICDLRNDELLQIGSIRLPHLQTFRFRLNPLSGKGSSGEGPEFPEADCDVSRIISLMFFGPINQIWENVMRVKVSFGKDTILNIDAASKLLFQLDGIYGGFEFLEILKELENACIYFCYTSS